MNSAHDCLPMIRQLPQEPNDVPSALTVETRGRLIQKEEEFRLASKLDSNRQPLSRFNSKAEDESVGEWLKFEEFDDFLHVGILLCLGNFVGLTQVCRESHSLSNGCGALVDIHLLSYFQPSN